ELVQRQIRDGLAQPAVLQLKVLEALHLLALQPAKLLAPPIIRHLAHPDLADCVHHVLTLRDQNIDLPQLRDDLFRLVSLPCHCSPPGSKTYLKSDHFNGGGSIIQVDQDMRTEVGKDLAEIRAKTSELVEKKVAAEDQLRRIDIRAPQDGIVHQLAVH